MSKEENKYRIYGYAPKSWFTVSGMPLGVMDADSPLFSVIQYTCFQNFTWDKIRIYTKGIPSTNTSFNLYLDGDFVRNISLVSGTSQITYTFADPIEVFEEQIITIELVNRDPNYIDEPFYFSFSNSTWECFLNAVSELGEYLESELASLKEDIFLKYAKGIRLDQWAKDFTDLSREQFDSDNVYRQKILTEILRPKQTRRAILDSLKLILDEYYPPELYSGSFSGFYSGSAGLYMHSGTGYSPIITECYYEDAPYVSLIDQDKPGRFYITIPYELLNEASEEIFNAIKDRVEAIKAKGVKVVYIKDTKVDNIDFELFSNSKIFEEVSFIMDWNTANFREQSVYTLTGTVIEDLEYISRYEYDNFISFGGIVDVIDVKNKITYLKVSTLDEYNEEFIFNQSAFYVGVSALGEDLFIYVPYNFDRCDMFLHVGNVPATYVYKIHELI